MTMRKSQVVFIRAYRLFSGCCKCRKPLSDPRGLVCGSLSAHCVSMSTSRIRQVKSMMRFVRSVALSACVIVSAIEAQNIVNQFSISYDYRGVSAPSANTITPTGNLNSPRQGHTATLLPNGKVLIAGGFASLTAFPFWATTELYDPATGTFSPGGSMNASRSGHTATLLPDGKVLLAGGDSAFGNGADGDTAQSSAEVYDPETGTFTPTGSMTAAREGHTATLLNNGKVLIAGGVAFIDGNQTFLGSAELYDPLTGAFTPTGSMNAARTALTATLLASSKVLFGSYFNYDSTDTTELEDAELYDPATGTFSLTGRTAFPELRSNSTSLLATGDVLETLEYSCDPADLAEIYHSSTGTFTAAPKMSGLRGYSTATLLPDGTVLIDGQDFSIPPVYASAELYDSATGAFSPVIPATSQQGHTATLLPDGTVLLAGGWICCGTTITTAEIYHPAVLQSPPVLLSAPAGQGAILHASNQQLVSPDNPATAGEALEMFLTGLIDGSVIPPQVAIGGEMAEVLFFGDAPGYPGLNQVNIRVPNNVAPGAAVPVVMNYMARPSNQVTIAVSSQ
jgi:uncharacterized protein (TIGR03437 family)